ncbi:hypothetical protein [Bacillus sp. KH172YL63]|uniref:hypothetical protein n=1 Tax=Bacillus sp. KH172YL63 TaxID=2709784 RepID=UPI0013E4119A|nr:hypothetical protein [Bacillus sp. KH172YL63]BCB03568.1 hypothetical protein KH172YL63_17010 [Bacillus sp. KH172YL63]
MKLTHQQWQNAKSFIKTHARPLEQKLFTFYFENGSKEDVIKELSHFQNPDGGFGRSIEPDFRLEASSPLATTIGLQHVKELGLSMENPIVRKAMNYLEASYDEGMHGWNAVPEEVNSVPHAPWWHVDEEKGRCGVQTTWANPNAEIVSYFHLFRPDHPRLHEWTERAKDELSSMSLPIGMHDFLCYQRLMDVVTGEVKTYLFDILSSSINGTVCSDPARWNEYVAKPLQMAGSPSSPFFGVLQADILLQLEHETRTQSEEGYWQPNWTWFGQFNETWPIAEKEWRGILTLEMLRTYQAYGLV